MPLSPDDLNALAQVILALAALIAAFRKMPGQGRNDG